MTLEELLQAMKDAEAAAQAAPNDKALQAAAAKAKVAYDTAKAKADSEEEEEEEEEEEDDSTSDELSKLSPEELRKLAKKLRKENAGHRVKSKDLKSKLNVSEAQKKAILKAAGIEVEDENPEEQVKALNGENATLAFRLAIRESALEHGIGKDELEFFEFLVSKATSELEDGDELTEEQMTEIAAKAKAKKGSANTTTNNGKGKGKGGNPPPPAGGDDKVVTLDKFLRMTMMEKAKLYDTNRDMYTQLVNEAKRQKKLV